MRIVFMETDTMGDDVDYTPFYNLGEVVKYNKSEPEYNQERVKDADVIVVNKIPMNEETLKYARHVKLICLTATGTNTVDFDYVRKRNIAVTNVKGYSTQSVIQHTFALLFYVYEKLSYYDQFVKSGEYAASDIFSNFDIKFNELYGKTWGIIGLGEIGRGVAKVAEAFGCHVIYYSTSGNNSNSLWERVEFDALLNESDIISIHAPLNPATEYLIDEDALKKMKKTAVLLNLGRGNIIREEALLKALETGEIAGAGLDVISAEPILPDNPLLKIKDSTKLIITPHIAWATVEARRRCLYEVYENMVSYLRGEERNRIR
ncbi:D-2-hydroxyacid dehydrogenase [Lacrimispora sp. AGF001]|jgi:glycerate dehydrogenase|uniref:D-2-hydroxyacid dehydrogenase n=1 Tax=Lacrimispora sp. AGF001 TaxID=3401631 RepID=UPI003B4358D1